MDCSLLGVCKAWVFRWLPTFLGDLLPLSSTQKTESAVLDCGLLSFDIIYPGIGRFGGIYCLHLSPEDEVLGFKLYWLSGFWRRVTSDSEKPDTSTFCQKIQTVGSFKTGITAYKARRCQHSEDNSLTTKSKQLPTVNLVASSILRRFSLIFFLRTYWPGLNLCRNYRKQSSSSLFFLFLKEAKFI